MREKVCSQFTFNRRIKILRRHVLAFALGILDFRSPRVGNDLNFSNGILISSKRQPTVSKSSDLILLLSRKVALIEIFSIDYKTKIYFLLRL